MRHDEVPLDDILNAARRATSYIAGMSHHAFLRDAKTRAAVLFELVIMGEAASRVSESFRDAHPELPWKRMIALRNFYVHAYEVVNSDLVWVTLTRYVPRIEAVLSLLLPPEPPTDDPAV